MPTHDDLESLTIAMFNASSNFQQPFTNVDTENSDIYPIVLVNVVDVSGQN